MNNIYDETLKNQIDDIIENCDNAMCRNIANYINGKIDIYELQSDEQYIVDELSKYTRDIVDKIYKDKSFTQVGRFTIIDFPKYKKRMIITYDARLEDMED